MAHHRREGESTKVGRERDWRGLRVRWKGLRHRQTVPRHPSRWRDGAKVRVTQTLSGHSEMAAAVVVMYGEPCPPKRLPQTGIILRCEHALESLCISGRRHRPQSRVVSQPSRCRQVRLHRNWQLVHDVARILRTVERWWLREHALRRSVTFLPGLVLLLQTGNHTPSTTPVHGHAPSKVRGRGPVLRGYGMLEF